MAAQVQECGMYSSMKTHEVSYLDIVARLLVIAQLISANPRKAFPKWVFDIESCNKVLFSIFQKESVALGYSGKLKENNPGLQDLRKAILKLAGLSMTGGFGICIEMICQTIRSAVHDLEQQWNRHERRRVMALKATMKS